MDTRHNGRLTQLTACVVKYTAAFGCGRNSTAVPSSNVRASFLAAPLSSTRHWQLHVHSSSVGEGRGDVCGSEAPGLSANCPTRRVRVTSTTMTTKRIAAGNLGKCQTNQLVLLASRSVHCTSVYGWNVHDAAVTSSGLRRRTHGVRSRV